MKCVLGEIATSAGAKKNPLPIPAVSAQFVQGTLPDPEAVRRSFADAAAEKAEPKKEPEPPSVPLKDRPITGMGYLGILAALATIGAFAWGVYAYYYPNPAPMPGPGPVPAASPPLSYYMTCSTYAEPMFAAAEYDKAEATAKARREEYINVADALDRAQEEVHPGHKLAIDPKVLESATEDLRRIGGSMGRHRPPFAL